MDIPLSIATRSVGSLVFALVEYAVMLRQPSIRRRGPERRLEDISESAGDVERSDRGVLAEP